MEENNKRVQRKGKKQGQFEENQEIRGLIQHRKLYWFWCLKIVAENIKYIEEDNINGDEAEAYIVSIFKNYANKYNASNATAAATTVPPYLKGTIKQYKNTNTNERQDPTMQVSSKSSKNWICYKSIDLERTKPRGEIQTR